MSLFYASKSFYLHYVTANCQFEFRNGEKQHKNATCLSVPSLSVVWEFPLCSWFRGCLLLWAGPAPLSLGDMESGYGNISEMILISYFLWLWLISHSLAKFSVCSKGTWKSPDQCALPGSLDPSTSSRRVALAEPVTVHNRHRDCPCRTIEDEGF